MQTTISLKYNGPAVDAGLMNAYDVAANMIAFSDFVVLATKTLYGEKTEVRAEVAGFGKGSFVTDLFFQVVGGTATLLSTGTAKELIGLVVESLKLWKHLKGDPPESLERVTNDNSVRVTNRDGQVVTFSNSTLNVVFSDKGAETVGRFIRDALSKEGVDGVSLEQPGVSIERITKDEARYFAQVAPETPLYDHQIQLALIIEAPVFKDGNKWRFSDGTVSFYVDIADPDFLARVDGGEAFAKGDSLIVEMRIEQRKQGEKITTERVIVKVLDHKRRPTQGGFPSQAAS